MAKVDEVRRRFWGKVVTCFTSYYPCRIKNVGLDGENVRKLVWSFKSGENTEYVAQKTADELINKYGDDISGIVFVCVPASSKEKNEIRYKNFSKRVCELSGAINAYDHVRVVNERPEIHKHRKQRNNAADNVESLEIDKDFFNKARFCLFDDLLTSGASGAALSNKLEQYGAQFLGFFALAKTTYKL